MATIPPSPPPLLPCPPAGEISSLQAEVLRSRISRSALPGLQVRQSTAAQALASRAHLEASLSTALALQSPHEYRRWLLSYARFLAEQGDAPRLGEVCTALLGGGSAAAAGGDAEMADADAADGADGAPAGGGEAAGEWQPTVLGLSKHELLGEVLKEMGRNRHLQRTTQPFLDALADLKKAEERAAAEAAAAEAAEAAAAAAGPAPSPVAPAAHAPAALPAAAVPAATVPAAPPAPRAAAVPAAPPAPPAAAVPAAPAAPPAMAVPAAPPAPLAAAMPALAHFPAMAGLQQLAGVPHNAQAAAIMQALAAMQRMQQSPGGGM